MTSSQTDGSDRDALYRKVAKNIIPLLIVVYVSAFIDRSNIAVAKLDFMGDVGLTEAAYGLGGGLFYLGYCLFEVPSNLLLVRIGAKHTLVRIIILWSLFSAAFALVTLPWHFYTLRFLLGAAEAGLFPGVLFYLSQWAPVARRARLTAYFMSAMALAGVLTGPISAAILATTDGLGGLHAWQWLFLIEGAPGLILAAVVFRHLADRPDDARWLTEQEKAYIRSDLAAERLVNDATSECVTWTAAFRDPRFYALGAMAVALLGTISGITLWVPTIIKSSGVDSTVQVSLLSSIPYIAGVVMQQLVARASDRRQERVMHAAIPAMVAAVGWMILPLASGSPAMSLLVLSVVAGATFGVTAPFWSMPASLLPGKASAAGIALVTTAGGIGAFVTPIIVGWGVERTGNFAIGQYFYACLIGLAAIILVACRRHFAGNNGAGKRPATKMG